MLQRIYGTAWAKKEDLEQYLHMLEEAEKRDHRKLGRELDLFHIAGGSARAWCSGIRRAGRSGRQVEQYMREVYRDNGYQEVQGPADPRPSLWEKIGPLGELPREHVHDGVGEARLRAEADELPRPRADLQARACAATATCRCATASSASATATSRRARCTASCGCAASRRTTATSSAPRTRSSTSASPTRRCCRRSTATSASPTSSTRSRRGPDKRIGADEIWDKAEHALMEALRRSGVRVRDRRPARAPSTARRSSTR